MRPSLPCLVLIPVPRVCDVCFLGKRVCGFARFLMAAAYTLHGELRGPSLVDLPLSGPRPEPHVSDQDTSMLCLSPAEGTSDRRRPCKVSCGLSGEGGVTASPEAGLLLPGRHSRCSGNGMPAPSTSLHPCLPPDPGRSPRRGFLDQQDKFHHIALVTAHVGSGRPSLPGAPALPSKPPFCGRFLLRSLLCGRP